MKKRKKTTVVQAMLPELTLSNRCMMRFLIMSLRTWQRIFHHRSLSFVFCTWRMKRWKNDFDTHFINEYLPIIFGWYIKSQNKWLNQLLTFKSSHSPEINVEIDWNQIYEILFFLLQKYKISLVFNFAIRRILYFAGI